MAAPLLSRPLFLCLAILSTLLSVSSLETSSLSSLPLRLRQYQTTSALPLRKLPNCFEGKCEFLRGGGEKEEKDLKEDSSIVNEEDFRSEKEDEDSEEKLTEIASEESDRKEEKETTKSDDEEDSSKEVAVNEKEAEAEEEGAEVKTAKAEEKEEEENDEHLSLWDAAREGEVACCLPSSAFVI